MNVRDLTIELRPRSGWEAMDLGNVLARHYYRDLLGLGWKGFGVVFLLLAALCWKVPLLLIFLIWWLKPLMDRFYLFYLSRRIFGQDVTVRETLREWPRLLRKGTFRVLIWLRFAPCRSMTMAVTDLESLTGSDRNRRVSIVTRVGSGSAFLLTCGGVFLEGLMLFAACGLGYIMLPQVMPLEWEDFAILWQQEKVLHTVITLLLGLCYGVIVLLLEPFYLAGGFALYLNSRTSQEAWDVELRFRELAARLAKTRLKAPGSDLLEKTISEQPKETKKPKFNFVGRSQVLLLSLLSGFLLNLPEARAQELDPQQVADEVLAHEDFTWHIEKYQQRVRKPKKSSKSGPSFNFDGGPFAGVIFQMIGYLALSLLVIAIVVGLIHLVTGRRSLNEVPREKGRKKQPPKVVLGMDVTPESLPDDLLGQARLYWNQGQARLALSLLYRGALTKLITEQEVTIESSDTESECLSHVEASAPQNLAHYFGRLSRQWMKAAYSREQVTSDDFETLCATWPFGRRTS